MYQHSWRLLRGDFVSPSVEFLLVANFIRTKLTGTRRAADIEQQIELCIYGADKSAGIISFNLLLGDGGCRRRCCCCCLWCLWCLGCLGCLCCLGCSSSAAQRDQNEAQNHLSFARFTTFAWLLFGAQRRRRRPTKPRRRRRLVHFHLASLRGSSRGQPTARHLFVCLSTPLMMRIIQFTLQGRDKLIVRRAFASKVISIYCQLLTQIPTRRPPQSHRPVRVST